MIINRNSANAPGRLPLASVRVLDLTDEAAVLGPRLLADLGAAVYRVESTSGDALRRRGPFLDGQPGVERSLAHLLYNAGKRSAALALDTPAAWELVDRMVSGVDVVIAPLEKTELARHFFDEARWGAVHPGTGIVDPVFRHGLPQAAVTDLVGTAAGGLLYLNGYPEDAPNVPAGKLAYKQLSLAVALAAMSAIMTRARGRTGWQTVSMQEAVMLTTLQTANENYWHWHRTVPQRRGIAGLGGRSIYQAADGRWLSFTIPPPYWGAYTVWLAEVTGRTEFQGEQWRDRHHQIAHVDEINKATEALCAALPRDTLVEEGQRRHLLVLPVNNVAELAADPHLRERGFFTQVWHPQFERALTMPASAMLSSAYEAVTVAAPMLGQHTSEALRELAGLTHDEIASLAERRIAMTAPALVEAAHG